MNTKIIVLNTSLISAPLFSGLAVAVTPDQEGDILHGNGAVPASPAVPYVAPYQGGQGTEGDLLSHLDELHSGTPVEAESVAGEQDNVDDLIDSLS